MRLSLALLTLALITLAQLGVGSIDGRGALEPNAAITSSAIVIALVKVRIIMREIMGVRHAPVLLCRLPDFWVVIAGVSLLGCSWSERRSYDPLTLNTSTPCSRANSRNC